MKNYHIHIMITETPNEKKYLVYLAERCYDGITLLDGYVSEMAAQRLITRLRESGETFSENRYQSKYNSDIWYTEIMNF